MSSSPKTIGFAAVQLSSTIIIRLWCEVVRQRFLQEHPGGRGTALANIYWDFSWIGITIAALLTIILVVCQIKRRSVLYESTFYLGIWLQIVWFGVGLVAMEASFVGWSDLRGTHY